MRKLFFLLLLAALTSFGSQALTVNNTAGQLSQLVTNTQITDLKVTGTMDARDFLFITNELAELKTIDLSGVNIVAVDNGTTLYGTTSSYRANEVPRTAFFGKKLTSVVLPANIQSVGYAAFAGCYQLRSVTFPASLLAIGDYAFAGSALTSVNVPASVEILGKGAFARCESLVSATINAMFIDNFTFLGDTHLSQVSLGPTVTNISKGMFNGCTALQTIDIDPTCRLSCIDDEAFINSGLQKLDIQHLSVGAIGEWALAQTQLKSIHLTEGMVNLGVGALAHNRQLTKVTIPYKGNTAVGHGPKLRGAPSIDRGALTSNLARIEDYTFAGDTLLNAGNLLVPGISHIGSYALYNVCQEIDTMRLPASTKYLGDRAMAGMTGMKTLKTSAAQVPALGADVWAGVDQASVPLIAPSEESTELYKAADQWMNFFYAQSIDILLGDVDGNGIVNVTDVTVLINYLLTGTGDINMANADVSQDGFISIQDVTTLIRNLLNNDSKLSIRALHEASSQQFNITSDVLTIPTVGMRPGETRTINVSMNNTEHNYSAMRCELVLPEGLTLNSIKGIHRGRNHSFAMQQHEAEENVYSLIAVSMNMDQFMGSEGEMMQLTVTADESFNANLAEVKLTNIVLLTPKSQGFLACDALAQVNNSSGIEQISADKQIAHVRYINAAGQQSDSPFTGVNIVVTTYTDGTTTTCKVIK